MEWLHQGCDTDLSADFLNFGTDEFPVIACFEKVLKKLSFSSLAPKSGFGASISGAVVRSSMVLRNSVSADRTVMAATRFLGAMAACVMLLSFAAAHRKFCWGGCIRAAIPMLICQQIFSFWG